MKAIKYRQSGQVFRFYVNGRYIGRGHGETVEDAAHEVIRSQSYTLEPMAREDKRTVAQVLTRLELASERAGDARRARLFAEVDKVAYLEQRQSVNSTRDKFHTVHYDPSLYDTGCRPSPREVRATPRWAGMM